MTDGLDPPVHCTSTRALAWTTWNEPSRVAGTVARARSFGALTHTYGATMIPPEERAT